MVRTAMRQRLKDRRAGAHDDDTANCEVLAIRQLRRRPTLDDVIHAVVREMRVDRATICRRHSRHVARSVTLYLAHAACGLPQREIAAASGVGHAAVSKAVTRIAAALTCEPWLRQRMHRLRIMLGQVAR